MTYMLSYGAQFYDKIYSKFGGGLSHEITLNTKDPINFGGLTSGAGNVLSGKLLYSNDKIFVVLVHEQPITLAVGQIKASIIDIKPDKFNIYKMSKTVRRLGISWYINPFKNTTSKQKQVTPFNLGVDKPFHPDCYYDWNIHCNLMRDVIQVEK